MHDRVDKEEILEEFKPLHILKILKLFLPMERADCFYNQRPTDSFEPGFHWYSSMHDELERNGIPENPEKACLLDRRYLMLYRLCDPQGKDSLARMMQPARCPTNVAEDALLL